MAVPSLGLRIPSDRPDWVVAGPTGNVNEFLSGTFELGIGEWHTVELFLYPLGDGTNHWEFQIDGEPLVDGISYEPITGWAEVGVEIGISGSDEPTQVKFDNVLVEILWWDAVIWSDFSDIFTAKFDGSGLRTLI